MNSATVKKSATAIRLACAFLFLVTGVACSHDPLTITGRVVDESGQPLSDVSVRACYSGWGQGEAGYLVWDKDYCSETALTDPDGSYVITFEGPVSSRVHASKDGWVQTRDYNTTHSRIVLSKSADNRSRLSDEAKQAEREHRRRRAGESETDYYCRVILPGNQEVRLNAPNAPLAITPTLLVVDARSDALFAVRGSLAAASAFTEELVIKIHREVQSSKLSVKPVPSSCAPDVHFIGVHVPGLDAWPEAGVEFLVPSSNAMFDAHIHGQPAPP